MVVNRDPCLNGVEPGEGVLTIYLSPIALDINPICALNKVFITEHELNFPDQEITYDFQGDNSTNYEWVVKNNAYFINNNGERYQLESFHTHKKGEHTINGERFDLELHFVFPEPIDFSPENILVLGLLFKVGDESSQIIKEILDNKPIKIPTIIKESFCTYNGSLTKQNLEDIDALAVNWNIIRLSIKNCTFISK